MSTSLIDIPSLDEDVSVEETGEISAASDGVEAETGDGAGTGDTPGEAVLTSVTAGSSFAAEAKLTREQVRAKNKETLLEVINNNSISEDQKQYAVDSMNAMVDAAEREASAELLLDSKGFLDAVVSISDGTADVVINQAEISEAERAADRGYRQAEDKHFRGKYHHHPETLLRKERIPLTELFFVGKIAKV